MQTKTPWDLWKDGFYAWENATAKMVETCLRSPLVLGPSGKLMTTLFKAKASRDKALADWWSACGMPTRGDQERTLHLLNQLHSRLHDLEEKLEDLEVRGPESEVRAPVEP